MPGFLPVSMSVEVVKDRPTTAMRLALARPAQTEVDRAQAKVAADAPAGALGGVVGSMPAAPPSSSAPVRVGGNLSAMARSHAPLAAPAAFNTEAYDKIDENRFRRVADDPLSTFSIDVDTASYANVRRFLNAGHAAAGRRRAHRGADQLLPLTTTRTRRRTRRSRCTTEVAGCPWNPQHRLVRIGLKGAAWLAERTPPRATWCS